MGDKTLTVRRATSSSGQVKSEQEYILAQARLHIAMQKMAFEASGMTIPGTEIGPVVTAEIPTKVLCLTEVITPQELFDDVKYGEILEDMKEEGQKFGDLIDVVIPRPEPDQKMVVFLGRYFSSTLTLSIARKQKQHLVAGNLEGILLLPFFILKTYNKKDYAS